MSFTWAGDFLSIDSHVFVTFYKEFRSKEVLLLKIIVEIEIKKWTENSNNMINLMIGPQADRLQRGYTIFKGLKRQKKEL